MRGENRQKFIFWLFGFGCGIVLSGIMIVAVIFNTIEYQQQLVNKLSISEEEKTSSPVIEEAADNTSPSGLTMNNKVEDPVNNQELNKVNTDDQEASRDDESILSEEKQEEKQKTITVHIPSNANATEICELLEKEGVIQNADDFLKYIIKNKKTKRLRGGIEKEFPINENYDVILSLLVTK